MSAPIESDPSPNKKVADDAIIFGDYQDGQLLDPPTHRSRPYLDVTEGVDSEGDWQFPTMGALPGPGKRFHNRDFRNPYTGESIVPTQVYAELQREVQNVSTPHEWRVVILGMFVFVMVAWIPFMEIVLEVDGFASSTYVNIACFAGSVLVGFLVWKTGMQWIYKSLHARMERVVQERQGTLMECGVKVGYSHETTECYGNRSHLWLRRIPGAELPQSRIAGTPAGRSLESMRDEDQQPFPPIFIRWMVPGEIHIAEKEYDPSMALDQEVWTMIQKAHLESFKPCNRYLAILMAALAILAFIYTILISFFMYLFGGLEAWLGYFGVVGGFFLTWYILDRMNVHAWSQVADQVTLLLLNSESPIFRGIQLKFEASLLPYRNGSLSRRYQLVRVPGNDSDNSYVVDGQVDQDSEHHIL